MDSRRFFDYFTAGTVVLSVLALAVGSALESPRYPVAFFAFSSALVGALYLLRFARTSWRPLRTRPFTLHTMAMALIVLPSSLAGTRPALTLPLAGLACAFFFAFSASREAFSAEARGFLSPWMFPLLMAAACVASVAARVFSLLHSGWDIFPLWFSLARETSLPDAFFVRLLDLLLVVAFPVVMAAGAVEKKSRTKAWWYAAAGIAAAGIFLSFSRAAWVALAGEACLFIALDRARRRPLAIVAAACLIAALLVPGVRQRAGSIFDPAAATNSERLEQWSASLTLIGRSPFVGYGLGSFGDLYRDLDDAQDSRRYPIPHNLYLHLAVECGLPALFVFLSWIFWLFSFLRSGGGAGEELGDQYRRGVSLGAPISLAGFLIFGLFDL